MCECARATPCVQGSAYWGSSKPWSGSRFYPSSGIRGSKSQAESVGVGERTTVPDTFSAGGRRTTVNAYHPSQLTPPPPPPPPAGRLRPAIRQGSLLAFLGSILTSGAKLYLYRVGDTEPASSSCRP